MEWVHCNSCYCQPSLDNKELVFSLTSCGHILCNKCTANKEKYCLVCQSSCNLVCLSKQVPQEIIMYFTSLSSLLDKFITQFERVVQFQNTQRTRLMKYKIHQIQLKTKEKAMDITRLEKENALLKMKLDQTKISSPMNFTPSPPVPFSTPTPSSSAGSISFLQTPLSASPSLRTALSNRRGPSPTIRKRPLSAGSRELRSASPSPLSQLSSPLSIGSQKHTPQSGPRTLTSANRLCIRTPPFDGKIGVIPRALSPSNKRSIISSISTPSGITNTTVVRTPAIGNSKSPYSYPPFVPQLSSLSKPSHPPCTPPTISLQRGSLHTPTPQQYTTSGRQSWSSLISRIKQ